jgi:radical SAM protein with 4Fe4S-binding SPASM domain
MNNKSTHDFYLSKKDVIKKVNFSKVMISPDSLKEATLLENYLFFRKEFGDSFRENYALVRDGIWFDKDIRLFEDQSKELIDYLLNEININNKKELGLPGIYQLIILDIIMAEKMNFKRPFGCFAGINGAGFMHDGTVYPCARFGSEDSRQLIDKDGKLNIENLEFMKNVADINKFQKCLDCEFYKYCNTGCTYQQMLNNNNPVDCVCKLFKILYKHVNYFLDNVNDNYKYYLRRYLTEFFKNINN